MSVTQNDLPLSAPATSQALLLGSYVDMGGVARSKSVPVGRRASFARSGMGASPSWAAFCPDDQIAFTPDIGVSGDLRLRIDDDSIRPVSATTLWGPTMMETQEGEPRLSPRTCTAEVEAAAEAAGYHALVGSECEFYLLNADEVDGLEADGDAARGWHAYGVDAFLAQERFAVSLLESAERAGLVIEQIHCEYGLHQYEVSIAPETPLAAADSAVLLRILIKYAAKQHGFVASFSPKPFAELSGSGAHLHLSLARRDGSPVLSGGDGPHGLSLEGQQMIAGIQSAVVELTAVYAGSPVSPLRLAPHSWAGAAVCWGLENREAALRLCAATKGNPHGASIELKMVDPSANPYLAIAVLIGSALRGIRDGYALAAEVPDNPENLDAEARTAAHMEIVPRDPLVVTQAFERSSLAKDVLGSEVTSAILAVRNLMTTSYSDIHPATLCRRFRTTW